MAEQSAESSGSRRVAPGGAPSHPPGSARIIDGKAVAAEVRERVRVEVKELERQLGRPPGLATVLVGDDPASAIYVSRKREACEEVGIRSVHHEPEASVSEEELVDLVGELNEAEQVDGILVQLPLPDHVDATVIVEAISPHKDVDGLTPTSAGRLARGQPGLEPCTPRGVMELLRAGRPGLIAAEMVRPGATVIDVGTNRTDEGLVGDVDFEAVREVAGAITPVPGGVGPMTIAMLLANTVQAARVAEEQPV